MIAYRQDLLGEAKSDVEDQRAAARLELRQRSRLQLLHVRLHPLHVVLEVIGGVGLVEFGNKHDPKVVRSV